MTMDLKVTGEVWFWQGPAPWHFVTVTGEESAAIEAAAEVVSYGWGMVPVSARIGTTRWSTSLYPKDDTYVVPLKAAVRRAEAVAIGDVVTIHLTIDL
jgi:Domain of unknown function (DUF1905)